MVLRKQRYQIIDLFLAQVTYESWEIVCSICMRLLLWIFFLVFLYFSLSLLYCSRRLIPLSPPLHQPDFNIDLLHCRLAFLFPLKILVSSHKSISSSKLQPPLRTLSYKRSYLTTSYLIIEFLLIFIIKSYFSFYVFYF